jgi:P-type conjugative transfer protein TrbJ
MRTIALQQQSLQNDAMNLQMIQSQASGAQGQMQAIQAANQFASAQGNQLLQIRTLLLAAQNAVAARDRVVADREAQQSAAGQQLRQGSFRASSSRTW